MPQPPKALQYSGLTLGLLQRYKRLTRSSIFACLLCSLRGASGPLPCARVAELADARDLGSRGQPWGFKSPLSHQYNDSTAAYFWLCRKEGCASFMKMEVTE